MRYQSRGFAKVNLALHICGQRADGYHLLDSVVGFALDIYDDITLSLGADGIAVDGPFGGAHLAVPDNLCHRAAALMGEAAHVHLTKHIPIQAGIGGGSADAAAVLRALAVHQGVPVPIDASAQLGADVPVCCASQLCRMQGIGQEITPLGARDLLHAVLVNPNQHVPTPSVFRALKGRHNPPMPADIPTEAEALIGFLAQQRNDMQEAAIELCPVIAQVLENIDQTDGVRLARMSGSGATCFALYESLDHAQAAAEQISHTHPSWWCRATRLGSVPLEQMPYRTRAVT